MHARVNRGFTLVEILIVVVILGILAAVVVPQFTNASQQAAQSQTVTQLQSLRSQVELYRSQNNGDLPTVIAGAGDPGWAELLAPGYLRGAPQNQWVAGVNNKVVALGNTPDAAYQTAHAWIFDAATGEVYAGSFDGTDQPYPKP